MVQNRKNSREKKKTYLLKFDPDIDRKAVEIAIRKMDYKNLTRFLNEQMRQSYQQHAAQPVPATGAQAEQG